ncbi:MAG TPA: hypothetical protein PKD55_15385 [Bellilinea sp.]|nr:hypothetical protein [Bellilinea sp.]
MQIAAHVLAYNVTRTLRAVLENISPHVQKIYIAHPLRPWGYVEHSRSTKVNPTARDDILEATKGLNVEVIQGDWETEEETRNACLKRAKEDGFDWLLTQDADEFYTEHSWGLILKHLKKSFHEDHFVTTWYNFWKSCQYVVVGPNGEIKGTNAGFAVRCRKDASFKRSRITSFDRPSVLDYPCFHYGYVRTDAEIQEKVSTWAHANEFDALRWYRVKWANWSENTKNLHPTAPWIWKRAIRFPGEQPDFSMNFNLDFQNTPAVGISLLEDLAFDAAVSVRHCARSIKQSIKRLIVSK